MNALGKRAGFLALVLVMSTALVGAAYTLWYEDVQVSATVATTSLDASIACAPPAENEDPSWPPVGVFNAYPKPNPLKEVASASALPQTDLHEVELLVENAYPGYAWDCEVHIFNTDPLPWHLENIAIVVEECDQNGANCVVLGPPPPSWTTVCAGLACSWGDLGINPPGYPSGLDTWSPLFAAVTNWEGCQVHEEDFFGLSGSLFVGINQSAKENVVYKLTVTYTVNQWNESAWNGCNQPKQPL